MGKAHQAAALALGAIAAVGTLIAFQADHGDEANRGVSEAVGSAPTLCAGLLSDTDPHPQTPLAKPRPSERVVDPEFGSTIIRISDVAKWGEGKTIKPLYSPTQAWNADESYLLLWHRGGNDYHLHDGTKYEFVKKIKVYPADLEEINWHNRNPSVFFYPKKRTKQLRRYDVERDEDTLVHDFGDICQKSIGLESHHFRAWDSNRFGVSCGDLAFIYDADTDSVIATKASGRTPYLAPSGNYALLGQDVYDALFNFVGTLNVDSREHKSLGKGADGRDVYNTVSFDKKPVGTLISYDLVSGAAKEIISRKTGWPYPGSGTHVSSVAFDAPGWVAVSTIGYDKDGQDVLDSELTLANVSTGETCRVAHHRSHGKSGPQGYFAEPHVVISPAGNRMVFGSDWGGGDTVDAYVVELPSYVRSRGE